MKILVVDMTHGGILIASRFLKLEGTDVFAWDIYQTLNDQDKASLKESGVKFVEDDFSVEKVASSPENHLLVVAPVHCPISPIHLTHHDAVEFLLQDEIEVPVIEITGVKGKTSVVYMLKEIFKNLNPLILSSLGVEIVEDGKPRLLKQDISITPASIIEAWELAFGNEIGICIFETSLGGTGLADVGILTNIAEDYAIAGGRKKASYAKAQIFKNKMVACDSASLNPIYSKFQDKINTFGFDRNSNLRAVDVEFGLYRTMFRAEARDLKTITGKFLNNSFEVSTFAPAPHHLNNVLSAICAALMMESPIEHIIEGLKNYKGIKGRSSMRSYQGSRIIEEINPGINVTTIKKAFSMLENLENAALVFGGKYGVTCEEIDEEDVSKFLNKVDKSIQLVLTDDLGRNIKTKMERIYHYLPDFNSAVEYAVGNGSKTVLLIYRSNFRDTDKR